MIKYKKTENSVLCQVAIYGTALDKVIAYQKEIAEKKNTPIKNISKSMVINSLLKLLPQVKVSSIGKNECLISREK